MLLIIFKLKKKNKPHSVEILKHSKNYSKLLDIYVDSAQQNIRLKKWFKIIFFIITTLSLVSVVYLLYMTIQYIFNNFAKISNPNDITIEAILSIISIAIPALTSLTVAFIKIPEIIAEYLFNTKEDENMNAIIKNIQDYDTVMFEMEYKFDELLKEHKDQNEEVEDDNIEEPPTNNAS
ncbi:MAG: hypothetical protein NC489_26995 [Ruminococcus flavefaciens]|nr:hypothetical protein [Ruminococcus flavefaciens]